MDNQNKYVKDMTVGTTYKLLLAFAIPLLQIIACADG